VAAAGRPHRQQEGGGRLVRGRSSVEGGGKPARFFAVEPDGELRGERVGNRRSLRERDRDGLQRAGVRRGGPGGAGLLVDLQQERGCGAREGANLVGQRELDRVLTPRGRGRG
jgi:hypothetical protein